MKNLISKKLALLAIVLFASIGNAFGQSITFDFNGINDDDNNADALIVNSDSWVFSNETINFPEGEDVTIEVYAYNLYELDKVYVDDKEITIEDKTYVKHVFENISGNHTVNIVCKKLPTNTVALSFNYQDVARLCFDGSNFSRCPQEDETFEVPTGSNLRLRLEPYSSAYPVSSIKVDGNDVTTAFMAGNYSLTNIASNHTVAVTFERVASHTINVTLPDNTKKYYFEDVESGTHFGWSNSIELAAGKDVRLYFEPTTGYQVDKAYIEKRDGSIVNVANALNTNGYYEFKSLDANYEVSITTKKATQHTITIDFDNEEAVVYLENYRSDPDHLISSDSATPNETYEFNEGTTVRMRFWNNNWNYTFKSIKINGEDVNPLYDDNIGYYYDFNNLSADYSVVLTYEEMPSVTVNFDNSMGGVTLQNGEFNNYVSPNWTDYFPSGTTMRIIPYANDGYKVGSITVNDYPVELTNGCYEFVLNSNSVVTVNFVEAAKYDIVVNSDNWHGSYYISEDNPIREGTNVWMEIYPEEGYIATVSENGNVIPFTHFTSCSTGSYGYQFTKLDAAHDLDVTFLYTGSANVIVNYTQSHVESVSLNDCWGPSSGGTTMVTAGTTSSIRVNTRIGYEVERVVANGTELTADENGFYMFMVTSNGCTVTVTTKKKTAPAKVAFTLSELGVGTYFSEYDLNFSAISGIKVYVASGFNPSTNDLVLTRVHEVPAGTGLMVKGTPGNYEIPTCDTRYIYANMLKGVVEETQIWENWMPSWAGYAYYVNYVLDDNGDFNLVADGYELSANSAYLTIPQNYIENSSAKIHTIFLDDEEEINGITTGVGFIWAGEKRNATATDDVYNLQGQKINSKTLKPGIYIKNGKKFMVK